MGDTPVELADVGGVLYGLSSLEHISIELNNWVLTKLTMDGFVYSIDVENKLRELLGLPIIEYDDYSTGIIYRP